MNEHLRYIDELATKTLQSVDSTVLPVPIEDICKKLGLNVVEFDFPDTFSGVLRKEKMAIGVNKNHPTVRQRFTLAHELGHFLLGHEDDTIDGRSDRPMPLEREANSFASRLLIPADAVTKMINEIGLDLKALAKEFLVSEQAMTIRLLDMGFIK